MFATKLQHLNVATFLLEKGANVHAANVVGETALRFAANLQNRALVQLLLENGADINAANAKGYTALHFAACRQNRELVQLLLENEAEANLPAIITFAKAEDGSTKIQTYWPLSLACIYNNFEIASVLVARGANANVGNPMNRETPLVNSILYGNAGLVRLLLDNGVATVARNDCEDDTDPLVFALMQGKK